MPRINRKYYTSSFLHIMVQGINKEDIFKNDLYKNLYIKLINETLEEFKLKILAYVIMSNHAHILLSYNNIDNISKFMHKINQFFAQMYNKNENRVGYVFRGRYRCEQIKDEDHLYNVIAYIHFNPIKANITNKLSEYKFSSYIQYIRGNVEKEKVYMIFNTYDYKILFLKLHQDYYENYLKKQRNKKSYEDVIREFKDRNKISSMKLILKEKNLLIHLILDLEDNTNLSDKQICEILKIGKNRITNLKKKLK